MIQRFIQQSAKTVRRKGAAVMLAFWLNLALLPCAMALEVQEEQHDCCPPTIELQQADCCDLDAVSVDNRDNKSFDGAAIGPATHRASAPQMRSTELRETRPPDPEINSPPIYALNCVYLK